MSKYLSKDEFVPFAPDSPGVVRINHDTPDCSGNSKSLRIERKEDGTISAYCFRCCLSGIHSTCVTRIQEIRERIIGTSGVVPSDNHRHRRPRDCTTKTSEWPTYALKWIRQYGVTNEEILKYNIAYSAYYDRLDFPIYSRQGEYKGHAMRALTAKDVKPKWLIYSDTTQPFLPTEEESDVLVLVEDLVSGIRIARYTDCIVLLQTTIKDDTLVDIATGYNKYYVWLDDDNRQVKLNQLKLARRLRQFADVEVIHDTDPKRLDDDQIIEKL